MQKGKRLGLLVLVLVFLVVLTACGGGGEGAPIVAEMGEEVVALLARDAASDIRVMSYHILVHMESWGGVPVAPRAPLFETFITQAAPDVVALQEVCGDWHKEFDALVEAGYDVILPKDSLFTENRTPVMYNTKRLKLVDAGHMVYSKKDGSRCRKVTYGVFEVRESGKRFAVTSTHWDFGDSDKKIGYRTTQIAELAELVNQLHTQFGGIPVFAGGDYNTTDGMADENAKATFSHFLQALGGVDTKYREGIKRIPSEQAAYDYPEQTGDGTPMRAIDHIALKGEAKVKRFHIVQGEYFTHVSDHMPIYVDFAF